MGDQKREDRSTLVIKPTVNLICEPDYLNQTILLTIEQLNTSNEQKVRKFTLASNYENFIKLIETSDDRDKLEQFWYYWSRLNTSHDLRSVFSFRGITSSQKSCKQQRLEPY